MKNSRYVYPELEEKTIALAAKEGMLDRILFSSFNHHSLLKIKEIDSSLPCGLLYEATMVRPWAYANALGMDAIHPHFSEVLTRPEECICAHKAGIAVNPWTVNAKEDIENVISAGADIIITNYPDIALQCLTEKGSQI